MQEVAGLENCKTFINCQLKSVTGADFKEFPALERPTITLSRQAGAGGRQIAEHLAAYLHQHDTEAPCGWAVFDKNLVEKVLEDHHLPQRLARFMPENKISEIDDMVGEILGLHPSQWTLVNYTTETILNLAKMGNVIIIGRGAHIIAGALPNAFHVRLVGSLEKRAAHLEEYFHFSPKEALDYIAKMDRYRRHYVQEYFDKDLDDPLLYHLIINTDRVSYEEAARMIGDIVLQRQVRVQTALGKSRCQSDVGGRATSAISATSAVL